MYRTPRHYELAALKDFLLSAERSQAETEEFILANLENPVSPRVIASIFHKKAVDAYKAAGATVPRRPGFGLTLDWKTDDDSDVFPRLSFDDEGNASWRAHTLLIREVCMLRVVEELTNKPEWWRKVKDDEIAAKWKTEILQMDWKNLVDLWAVFTEAMADAVIAELRAKADLYQETGLIPVMDYSACAVKSDNLMSDALVQRLKAAVAPLEDVPDAAKDWHPGSNNKVLDLAHPSLFPVIYGRTRVLPNRTIGVADCLAHAGTGIPLPTLGQKKQRNPDRLIPGYRSSMDDEDDIELSTNYQWLPCDVELKDGKATIASYINNVHPVEHAALYPVIEEFINLALPAWDLVYRWPEEFEFKRMHWDEIYKWECAVPEFCKGECDPKNCPLEEGGVPRPGGGDDEDDDKGSEGGDEEADKDGEGREEEDDKESNGGDEEDNKESDAVNDVDDDNDVDDNDEDDNDDDDNDKDDNDDDDNDDDNGDDDDDDDDDEEAYENIQAGDAREQWFVRHHTMILPDPDSSAYCGRFAASKLMRSSPSNLFAEALQAQPNPAPGSPRLQVIVKLASIHLTPSKPQYDGGSWHVEGQLNERIVATALFYYDAHNVTPSALSLRTAANGEQLHEEVFYEQNDSRGIERALAIRARGSVLQDIGRVVTSAGRALFFPNLYQHRVGSFRLADPAKPGHRKILALFLVDPKVPVLSTANVPPQQRAWWEREVGADPADLVGRKLPNELREMVLGGVDFPISLQEAKGIREELMAERKILVEDTQSRWDQTEFNFCEH